MPPIRRLTPILAAACCLTSLRAAEPELNDLLRQGLYAEEVSRDPAAAAAQYEQILARFQDQQAIAATALFRLAEVRRQQDKKADAIKLYQQLLTDFPKAEAEAKLARQHLTELGGKIPKAGVAVVDEEELEIARQKMLLASSPDLALTSGDISTAVHKGWLKALDFLLTAGANVAGTGAMEEAASEGNPEIVNLLLAKAKTQVQPELSEALREAVDEGHLQVVKVLLAAGGDPNWQLEGRAKPPVMSLMHSHPGPGTTLVLAIASGHRAIAEFLIESKADVNRPSNGLGFTPLHAAALSSEPDAPAMIERLIKAGANVNALANPLTNEDRFDGTTGKLGALQLAVLYEHWDSAKTLLRHGADLKQPGLFDPFFALRQDEKSLAKIRFLLENGADPNVRDAKGDPILRQVVARGDVELLKLFLKRGADAKVKLAGWKMLREPGHGDPFAPTTGKREEVPGSLLDCVKAKDPKVELEITRMLLDAGAKADGCLGSVLNRVAQLDETGELVRRLLAQRPDFLNLDEVRGLKDWQPASRRIFLDEVLIPALAKEPGPLLFSATTGVREPLVTPDHAAPPFSTPELLLAKLEVLLPEYRETQKSETGQPAPSLSNHHWPALTLVRPVANGGFERQALDLAGDEALPGLRQGDLLELSKTCEPVQSSEKSEVAALRSTLTWHLRKRISFPVTLELDGQTREVKLRGDLLVFDPTKNQAPLLTAGGLARVFLPDLSITSGYSNLKENTILTVRRQEGPEVRMDIAAPAAQYFELQPGDHLILPDSKSVMAQADNPGHEPIRLVIPGYPYVRVYGTQGFKRADSTQVTAPPPTLIQLLTDAYFPHPDRSPFLEENLDESAYPNLMKYESTYRVPVIPPHPDFAHIRIKRTAPDGRETVMEVDLTESITRCTDATPPAEARQSDVELQPGDVVELPLKTDQLAQPWNGFSQDEERFFRKALGGFYTLKASDGIIEQREILYHQPDWRRTPHGLLPLPPKEGVASTRAHRVGRWESLTKVVRGNDQLQVDTAFVRDGDQLLDGGGSRVTNPNPTTPRSRYVPPPPVSR